MDGMFFQDQKQKEQAKLKLKKDSEQYFRKVEGKELLSEQYSYFEKPESVLTDRIPKEADIEQAAVMSHQEESKKSKDEKDLEKKALEANDKERLYKRKVNLGLTTLAVESKELMDSKIEAIKQGLVVSEKKIKEYYEPLIKKAKDKAELEREYDLALKKARYESARDIGEAASYYVETLKASEVSEETLIAACAHKEELLVQADALKRSYRASSISNQQEREREEGTVKKHYWYDVLKGIFRKSNPYSHEGAVIKRGEHTYVNVGRAFFGGTKPMYIFEDRTEGMGTMDEEGIIHYPQYLYKEAINCIGMDKPEGGLATEAAAKIQELISGKYAIDAFAVRDKDGKVCGSLQQKLDKYDPKTGGAPEVNLYSWQENPEQSISNGQGDDMDKQIKREVLREHTLDWLLCNFDTKGENFIYRTDKHLSSFDKEASFSFLKDPRSQTMSLDYMPHSHNTIYNVLFTSFIEGKQDLDFEVIEENILNVEKLVKENDGEKYMANFKAMLDQKYGPESPKNTKRKEAYDLILKRATDIRETYSVFLGQLIVKRDEFINKQNSTITNPYMQNIEFVSVEGSEEKVPRLIFSDEKTARTQFENLEQDHSAEIHPEKLEYTPETLTELKRATDAFLVKCEAITGLRGLQKQQFDVIFAKMKEQKKRLDGYTPEDINSGAWLDKEKGLYFYVPQEEKIKLEVTELPDIEMKSDAFNKKYQERLKTEKEGYTREEHYINACHHHLHQFQKRMEGICNFRAGGGIEFIPELSQLFNRVRSGKAVPSDIPHLEKLRGAFVFIEKMMNDLKVFDDRHPANIETGTNMKLKEDINALNTYVKTAVGHYWNLLSKELKSDEIKEIEMVKNTDGKLDVPAMIRSGVMSEGIDQLIFMAHNTELAKSPEMQKIAYSAERLQADELSKTRAGADPHISDEEAVLRLKDMEAKEDVSQAVLIAHDTEMETARLLDELKGREDDRIELDKDTRIPIKSVIADYTANSSSFRNYILLMQEKDKKKKKEMEYKLDFDQRRYETMEWSVMAMDKALEKIAALRPEPKPVTSYRYACYKDSSKPDAETGNPFGDSIKEGDIVMDAGFCSTSAAKQFIGLEETTSTTVTSYVKMSITGTSGVPIADPDGTYSNQAEAQKGQAGQAEILYPRNTCFRVVKINSEGTGDEKVSGVVLEEVERASLPKEQVIKDIYTGKPITSQQ